MRASRDPIQEFVPGGGKTQEAAFAPVQPQRYIWKRHTRERNGVDRVGAERLPHSRSKVRCEGDSVTGIPECVVEAIDPSRMRQGVESEIERTAPGVLDAYVPQLRKHGEHSLSEDRRTLVDRGRRFRHETRTSAKQHAAIRCQA